MGSDVVHVGCGLTVVPLNSLWFVLEGAWSLRLLKEDSVLQKKLQPSSFLTSPTESCPFHQKHLL